MNREIKFRAWDGSEMNYKAFGAKINPPVHEFGIDFPLAYSPYWTTGNMLALMQFTGLRDKNGKEIWEGDVLLYEWDSEDGPVSDRVKVEWVDELAGFVVPGLPEELEIIGNVWENPDLLPR